ncbi:RNA polymerase II C-terminal domain phosphatase-like 1 [Ipomoea triloba]|uniref:RNA polymerase II C-terminal domain phosphatase-like 1 n=1 Tax=Ipomoea triloba TaxID=35885 RepID=UPI00125E1D22|nr:RNA polymerase II C-terminal domain phosphatase-like 1 [Ipomoea triloba]
MYKSMEMVRVYEGETLLGEVELYPQNGVVWGGKEIRVSHYSQPSERCPPLAVLHTITSSSPSGLSFKLESKSPKTQTQDYSPLYVLHSTCLRENKTAVMSLGREELHLVAMQSREYGGVCPCFWGFIVSPGLYSSCLVMLNLRCLGIVFDLDETLIVANTLRSFEDRIENLQRKINAEADPQRVLGMVAEVKRYQEDKSILKQYAENDQVIDNGKVIKCQPEVFPALSDSHQPIVRPLIRLLDKNIILTRINPLIRDTSVLVRLRPAWEDLRSYLTARGRKRFEVYVCTMAERDYALEMWRLLDPDSNLISSNELLNRIVCVKSGLKKSLFNVFQDGNCHPKMSLVIDDRLKVWDEKDQPRVHVVPAFAPYYAPQAEGNNSVPVLCVARNVACNVRGGFFKDFDEGLLQRISDVAYEDDIKEIPSAPDVSNYLISEDDTTTSNGNKDSLGFDGMSDTEVEKRLKEALSGSATVPLTVPSLDPRISPAFQYPTLSSSLSIPAPTMHNLGMPLPSQQLPQATPVLKSSLTQVGPQDTSLQSSPAREEGEVPESELDPDTRRRLLILQHGMDNREHAPGESQLPVRPSVPAPVPRVQPRSWFPTEEEMGPGQLNRVLPPKDFPLSADSMHMEKHRPHHPPYLHKMDGAVPSDRLVESQMLSKEAIPSDDRMRLNQSLPRFQSFSGEEVPLARSGNRDLDLEPGRFDSYAETEVGALHDIALKCGTKLEYRSTLVSSSDLQFNAEAWFAGEKIGVGIGRTRREAQHYAAERSLKNLADKYMSRLNPDSSSVPGDGIRNGFGNDNCVFGYQSIKEDVLPFSSTSEPLRGLDSKLEASKKSMGSVAALRELCTTEGLSLAFQTQPQLSAAPGQKNEIHAQVEIDGEVFGKGIGSTWDEAKAQAAERALGALKSTLGQFSHKRQGSPRSLQVFSNKRLKPEYPRFVQRVSSSSKYSKNASAVP